MATWQVYVEEQECRENAGQNTEESEAIETDDASESTAELTDETGTDEEPADEGATE